MKSLRVVAALAGALGIVLGAFGAHALRSRLAPDQLQVFETAVRYQMYHVFAIFIATYAGARRAGWLFAAGILLFSGSLYGLVFTGWKWLGPITPLGGLAFIAGWIALAICVATQPRNSA